jgi:hypothetical protein
MKQQPLSSGIKITLVLAATIDLVLGLLIFFTPELEVSVWITPIAPLLSRFVGAIVAASGVGIFIAIAWGTWEGVRAQFVAGFVYGAMVLMALLLALLQGANPIFGVYAAINVGYLVPIALIFLAHERARKRDL